MRKYLPILGLALVSILTGCETMPLSKHYDRPAYKPKNPSAVKVKVSLSNRMVYVMEGDKPLLVTATAIGLPNKPTPKGNFTVFRKLADKRSGSYGFWIRGNEIVPGTSSKRPPGSGWSYKGFPMPYWVEFAPGYGFHEGSVWPIPRTHGCLRLHKNDAADFFALVKIGTPINIATTQPEDKTLGANMPRPLDYNDPDPANSVYTSQKYFDGIKHAELIQ